ncbi:unnamed protein product [Schistosoma mattheei]|uniref:Uncharacterized protein n=1 Tax=Schistosoma mattheei TaxID=31246 RepID=A0A3P8CHI3_9TREM|nr:unnamed protein product [Schistosoma mattheei]
MYIFKICISLSLVNVEGNSMSSASQESKLSVKCSWTLNNDGISLNIPLITLLHLNDETFCNSSLTSFKILMHSRSLLPY